MRATLGRPPVPISGFVHCVDDQREETEISCSPLSKMGEISLEKEAREIKKASKYLVSFTNLASRLPEGARHSYMFLTKLLLSSR